MKDEEKNLIENLFHRLKKTELKSSERDSSADDLIQNLVKKQPASSYYMAQTILIQETAIKKMSMKIEDLKTRIRALNSEELNNKPSFLSSFFKKSPSSQIASNNDNIWKKTRDVVPPNYYHTAASPTTQSLPTANTNSTTRSSSFLSSALQTATGVAGGMILGNMLMNVFNHTKPEEDIFDTVHQSHLEQNKEDNFLNNNDNHDLINYEYTDSDINSNESILENINNDVDYIDDSDIDNDDSDIDNDNFI